MNKVRNALDQLADGNYSDTLHPHKNCPEVIKLIFDTKLNKIVTELLGGSHDAVQSQLRYKKPGDAGFPLHQDDFWTKAGFGKTLNILIHVDDATKENGCIYTYPKSHKPPFFSKKVNLEAKSGDVTFLHNYVLHGSDKNKSNTFRRNLLLMYVKKNTKYRSGKSAKRDIIFNV